MPLQNQNDSKSSLEIQAENQRIEEEFHRKYNEVKDGLGQPMFTPKAMHANQEKQNVLRMTARKYTASEKCPLVMKK